MSKQNINRLVSVKPLDGTKMQVDYASGQSVTVDFAELAARYAVFAPLKDRAFFQEAVIGDWGHTLEWPNGEGLDADRVMDMALEQQGRADAVFFRRWQDRNGLSLAAAAIGLSRRTVSQYRTGARAVPRTVTLACKGWEAERETV